MANVHPKIVIDDSVYQEVMYYVNKSSFEVSGLGVVEVEEIEGQTILHVTKAILLNQKNTSVHTEIDPVAVGKAEHEHWLSKAPGELRWWWHSHVNMPTFWSGEDTSTIKELSAPGWFCATVFNQKEEWKSAFAQGGPLRVLLDDIECSIDRSLPDELTKAWDAAYEKNVCNEASRTYKNKSWSKDTWNGSAVNKYAKSQQEMWEDAYSHMGGDDPVDETLPVVEHVRIEQLTEEQGRVVDEVLEKALENGLAEEEAFGLADLAERLLTDGRYTPRGVENVMVQKVLSRAQDARKALGK